jgi:hypothetical protein
MNEQQQRTPLPALDGDEEKGITLESGGENP